MTVAAYYMALNKLWDEIGSYNEAACTCGVGSKRRRLMQFLMGLNESYSAIRGQILLMNPLPDVAQAYSSIIQEEKQWSLCAACETTETSAMTVRQDEPVALAVRHGQGFSSRSNSNRKPLHCSYCDRYHHVEETCWKLNGYPLGHPKHASNKSKQGDNHSNYNNSHQSTVNNVKDGPKVQEMQSVTNGLSDLQIQQILSIMNGKGISQFTNPKANAASASSGLSHFPQLIIDSGATDHITSSPNLLVNSSENTILPPVIMPSGEQAPITSIGTLPLNYVIFLQNVLGVPSCKVDLTSVSRITRDLNCSVTFFPRWCVLQDLMTRTTIGLGKQQDGLNYLVALMGESIKTRSAAAIAGHSSCSQVTSSTDLWHRRLGHLSSSRLDFMAKNLFNFPFKTNDACDVCALAKQSRLPFFASSISSVRPFELIHCDIWGPYKIPSLSGAKYFLTIVDDYSRFTWVFFMHHKNDTQHLLANFFSFAQTQFNASIANIRVDNGMEFLP